jgi:hypothetical protein
VTNLADLLKSCPHYEPIGPDAEIVRNADWPPETCGSCGGDPEDGPSCQCPVFGESEDA